DEVARYRPGLRPFEIALAKDNQERLDAIARGEEPDESPSAWFTRHGWTPAPTLAELPLHERAIVAARIERTAASVTLSLIEQTSCKRRWHRPDYDADERRAMETWLTLQVENWARERVVAFTVEDVAGFLQADRAVLAVGELLVGRPDFDL